MSASVDITICGAGPVGMVLAALLRQRGYAAERLLLLDAKTADQAAVDPRSIAMSYGSRQILERVGAWPIPAQPITQIHVSRRGHFGRTLIDAADYAVPALGYVTRYGALVTTLTASLDQTPDQTQNTTPTQSKIIVRRPLQIIGMHEEADHITLTLSDGSTVQTGLLIRVDGGVFTDQPPRDLRRDYAQTAIVTHVTASAPQPHRAFERFTAEGPLALLPQDGGYAVVWCAATDTASRLMLQDDASFLAALATLFGNRVGNFTQVGQRFAYPLGLNANTPATARSVAIGNAAQTLHPVAGQGLNLGLRDATVLAQCLASGATVQSLQTFTTRRKRDRSAAIWITDLMARVFGSAPDGALSQGVLGLSLGLLDALPPARRLLAEQMMYGQRP